ncbi:zinc dependent phospholipase C family protein [Methylobacillus flagellatus]|uniref:zinc dependent phospholipase C family protein n=1 Tax=Methylobacillus flagellatus TaxID=405 RepID=UPI0010F76496|nr:zinc dependent phospholipase C family protein [Methylobacillus flagellatus]
MSKRRSDRRLLTATVWLMPLVAFSQDANAWGLVTHVYFAQSLLWAMPLLDPRLQRAIRRFPELVMAGSCLPDLAIVSRDFRGTHAWDQAYRLLTQAQDDAETAIAIGYASHLYVDVVAHNHFVPAHEAMWQQNSIVTHIAAEWAMDAHLGPLLDITPGQLLKRHKHTLTPSITRLFGCSVLRAELALGRLSFWDSVLRRLRIPGLIYQGTRVLNRQVIEHFTYYIAKTQTALFDIGSVLTGKRPHWEAELKHLSEEELARWRTACLQHLRAQHPVPIHYFDKALQQTILGNLPG